MKADFIVFDLDGVIADTEPLHRKAKERLLAELACGVAVDLDAYVGRPNSELWHSVIARCGVGCSAEELERRQYDSILEQARANGTRPSAGLEALLDFLAVAGIGCGLCSSSDRYYVERMLAFLGLEKRFAPIVAGDEVPRKKPAPDGYRKATLEAGCEAGRVVAVEDSRAGVTAALAAGLRCIGYGNPTSGEQDLSGATFRVTALVDVIDWLREPLRKPALERTA